MLGSIDYWIALVAEIVDFKLKLHGQQYKLSCRSRRGLSSLWFCVIPVLSVCVWTTNAVSALLGATRRINLTSPRIAPQLQNASNSLFHGRNVYSRKGAITTKIKHAIKLKTSPARLAQLLQPSLAFWTVRRHWLQAKTRSSAIAGRPCDAKACQG